jgi:glycosyltransferase involved in cell wall biosynthesis
LTIGIDARAATEVPAGRGRVVKELLRAFGESETGHRYVCYARSRWDERIGEQFNWRLIPGRDPVWHVRAAAAASRECDVFLATNSYLTALLVRVPSVAIVHDLVTFDRAMKPNLRSTVIERLTLGATVRRAHGLVCVSRTTAEALVDRFPVAAPKTTVALLGVSPGLSASPAEVGELPAPGFVLAVGTLEPRKNLPRLVSAYAALPLDLQRAHPLVVVGAKGWSTGPTLAALRSLGERCIQLGHVSDYALAELYRRCAVFCFPSLGEGFGLPVLEAMAAGAAVLTSDTSSLPEVGGDAVSYVDPTSTESIRSGLQRLLGDPQRRAELAERGRRRAREFTWQRTGRLTLAALEKAAGR